MTLTPTLDGLPVLLDDTAPVTRRDRSWREVPCQAVVRDGAYRVHPTRWAEFWEGIA